MKTAILSLAVLTIFGLTACEKKDWDKFQCQYSEDKASTYEEIIYEPLVISDDCDCIVAGKVKYVSDCGTVALLDYGDGTCDNVAMKTTCKHGDCEGCGAETFEVTIECTKSDPAPPLEEENSTE